MVIPGTNAVAAIFSLTTLKITVHVHGTAELLPKKQAVPLQEPRFRIVQSAERAKPPLFRKQVTAILPTFVQAAAFGTAPALNQNLQLTT